MLIREIKASDRAQWDPLWEGYLDFYGAALDPAVTETTWARFLDPNEPMFALVAEGDGKLVGVVHCVIHRGTWSVGDFCYLEDLYVAPTHRGAGVGRALIEAVYARADALKCERTYWHTHESNEAGRRLYDRLANHGGFLQYRRVQP